MITPQETIYMMEQETKIVELFEKKDEFTTSDFQSALGAIILNIYQERKL